MLLYIFGHPCNGRKMVLLKSRPFEEKKSQPVFGPNFLKKAKFRLFAKSQMWCGSSANLFLAIVKPAEWRFKWGGQLLCFQPFLAAQWAKPWAYRQFFATFQPFQAHISGQEGRNDTL